MNYHNKLGKKRMFYFISFSSTRRQSVDGMAGFYVPDTNGV